MFSIYQKSKIIAIKNISHSKIFTGIISGSLKVYFNNLKYSKCHDNLLVLTYTLKYWFYCLGLYGYAWHLKLLQSGIFLLNKFFFYHSSVTLPFNQDHIRSSQSHEYIVTLCSFPSLFFIHISPQNIVSSSHHLTKFYYYDQTR